MRRVRGARAAAAEASVGGAAGGGEEIGVLEATDEVVAVVNAEAIKEQRQSLQAKREVGEPRATHTPSGTEQQPPTG